MSTRVTLIITLLFVILAVAFSAAVYGRLPEQMASHWGVEDQVNGYTSRFWGAFLMPIISLGMLALFLLLPNIDPLKTNIAKFREFFNAFIVLFLAFMLYMHFVTISWNLGYKNFKMSAAMLPAMGLLFMYAGLMLRKAKRNWFIGIRTPWTLSSDMVWDETHRIGSILFFVSGVLALIGGFVGGFAAFLLILIPLMGSTIFLVVYSYILYQHEIKA